MYDLIYFKIRYSNRQLRYDLLQVDTNVRPCQNILVRLQSKNSCIKRSADLIFQQARKFGQSPTTNNNNSNTMNSFCRARAVCEKSVSLAPPSENSTLLYCKEKFQHGVVPTMCQCAQKLQLTTYIQRYTACVQGASSKKLAVNYRKYLMF